MCRGWIAMTASATRYGSMAAPPPHDTGLLGDQSIPPNAQRCGPRASHNRDTVSSRACSRCDLQSTRSRRRSPRLRARPRRNRQSLWLERQCGGGNDQGDPRSRLRTRRGPQIETAEAVSWTVGSSRRCAVPIIGCLSNRCLVERGRRPCGSTLLAWKIL